MTVSAAPGHDEPGGPGEAAAAYMAMLRRIHEVSGLTAGQIAMFSGLPRSTAYRFIDPKNTTLPKSRNQVEAFLHACRLPQRSVDRMLELWDDVSGNARRTDAPAGQIVLDLPVDDPPPPKTGTSELSWQEWEEDLSSPRSRLSVSASTSAAQSNPPPEEDLILSTSQLIAAHSHPEPCVCLDLVHRLQVAQQPPAPNGAQQLVLMRVILLTMLILALYPLATAVWFGHWLTGGIPGIASAAIAVGLLLLISSRPHRYIQYTSSLTSTRLAGGVLGGICSGLLAWAAVPVLPTAVLNGFVVFTMVPVWLSMTEWARITTVQRAFVVITALWCGATLGTGAVYTGFPVTGSVLVGTLGAATAVAVLCSNLPRNDQTAWSTLARRASIHAR